MSKLTDKIESLNIAPVAISRLYERKDKVTLLNSINETNAELATEFSKNPKEETLQDISSASTVSCVFLLTSLGVANDENSLL